MVSACGGQSLPTATGGTVGARAHDPPPPLAQQVAQALGLAARPLAQVDVPDLLVQERSRVSARASRSRYRSAGERDGSATSA